MAAAGILPAQSIQVSASSLSFTATTNSTTPSSLQVSVSTTNPAPYTASIQYLYPVATGGWASVSPASGNTPATLTVTVDPTGLANGSYSAQLGIRSGILGALVNINLTVGVGGSGTFTASMQSINLSTPSALSEQVIISATNGGAVPFNLYASNVTGGVSWLNFSPTSGSSPAAITVSANTTGLGSGPYTGQLVVTPANGGAALTIPVNLVVNGTGGFGLSLSNSAL
ncbi:MAG: BACON domain-containing protein [Blastocatellia bacterium]